MKRIGKGGIRISIPLLLLDFIGSLLLALGLIEFAVEPGLVVPEAWQFPHYSLAMIVGGGLMVLLFVFDLVRQVGGRSRKPGWDPSQPDYRSKR